jgi:hypothetical protein
MRDPLRSSYDQLLASSRGNEAREGCVAPDQIVDLVEHRTPDPERMSQLSHVLSCEHCLREYEILRSLKSGADQMAPGRWRRTPVGRAAQLVLVAGSIALAAYLITGRIRSAASDVDLIAPAGRTAAGAPVTLRWRSVAGAASYRLEIMDAPGAILFSAFTLDTAQIVPDSVRLTAGVSYQWRVSAQMRGGAERRSKTQRLEIGPP